MRKLLLSLLTLLPLGAIAQESSTLQSKPFSFAVYSEQAVLHSLSDYNAAQEAQANLKAQYEAEAQRMATEFNNKYEEFIEVQHTLAPTILNKRQGELQELAERGEAFKQQALQQLKEAEKEALQPITQRVNEALQRIGTEQGYAFILNSDTTSIPFINPEQGVDITEQLQKELNP